MILRNEAIELKMGKHVEAGRLDGRTLFVSFDVRRMQLAPGRWEQPVTVCIIRTEDREPWITAMGISICHPNDIQDPKTGERAAFRRAMLKFLELAFPGANCDPKIWWDVFRKELHAARAEKQGAMASERAGIGQPVQVP